MGGAASAANLTEEEKKQITHTMKVSQSILFHPNDGELYNS
jgi:hypothetical protein